MNFKKLTYLSNFFVEHSKEIRLTSAFHLPNIQQLIK